MRFNKLIPYALTLFATVLSGLSPAQEVDVFLEMVRNNALEEVEETLKRRPELVNFSDDEGNTALIIAAYRGHEAMVELLVPSTENIDHASTYGTALMAASVKGELGIVKILLTYGADPNGVDREDTTALIYATMFKHEELALELLEAGGDPLQKNKKGFSALDYARIQNNTPLTIRFENHKAQ